MSNRLEFAKIENAITWLMTKSPGLSASSSVDGSIVLSDGTADLQGHTVILKKNVNLSNTNVDINVTTELDQFAVAAGLTKISAFAVKYESGTAGSYLTVKQPASNGVTNIFLAAGDGVKLAVGETHIFAFKTARAVTASTADIICNLVSTVTDAYYSLVVIGS